MREQPAGERRVIPATVGRRSLAAQATITEDSMERITMATAKAPDVDRLEVAAAVLLTFRGTRAEHVRDRDTWVRVSLPLAQAAQLWRVLGAALTDEERGGGDLESGPAF